MMDPASEVVTAFINAMRAAFDPASDRPPDGGGSTVVRFLAGDVLPVTYWEAHVDQYNGCGQPFLWVRVMRRYRSHVFPVPIVDASNCKGQRVLAIEIGVGRCASTEEPVNWDDLANEAEVSLDDSWRIELALCEAATQLLGDAHSVATDSIVPLGPEGGIVAWSAIAYVSI